MSLRNVNWRQMNVNLTKTQVTNTEISILNSLFDSVINTHTPIGEILFTRQYMFSVLYKLHYYLKETNMIQKIENLREIYDYVISTIIMVLELSTEAPFTAGINFFIIRIMSKIFGLANVNSGTVVLDPRYKFRLKYIVEPMEINKSNKISKFALKDYADFVFNTFSYCASSMQYVSISLLCSSFWINDFKEMPYLIDDQIIKNFSSDPDRIPLVNSVLLTRRDGILDAFDSGDTSFINLDGFSKDEYLVMEPDSLYTDLREFEKSHVEVYDDIPLDDIDEEDEVLEDGLLDYVLTKEADDADLPPIFNDELNMYDSIVVDLNAAINGTSIKSAVTDDSVRGMKEEALFPRTRMLLNSTLTPEITLEEMIDSLYDYEKKKKPKNERKSNTVRKINRSIAKEKEKKQKNSSGSIEMHSLDHLEKDLQRSPFVKSQISWLDFKSFLEEVLEIFNKKATQIQIADIDKIIDGYNKSKDDKVTITDLTAKNGMISFNHVVDDRIFDQCYINNGVLSCTPCDKIYKRRKKKEGTKNAK